MVSLSVYDLIVDGVSLAALNTKTLPFGFGAFHCGLVAHGLEYSFAVDTGTSNCLYILRFCMRAEREEEGRWSKKSRSSSLKRKEEV